MFFWWGFGLGWFGLGWFGSPLSLLSLLHLFICSFVHLCAERLAQPPRSMRGGGAE
jgi:hypothetical protein